MKKRGFTLIELIVYLAIAAIITSVAVTAVASVNNFRIEYTNKICQKEIALFIHRARMHCYESGVDGSINLDVQNNKLIFSSNTKTIDVYYLNSKRLQYSSNFHKISVNNYGNLDKNGTLSFIDENNKSIEITFHVASEVVDEK